MRPLYSATLATALASLAPLPAFAQSVTVQYDAVTTDDMAAITCGFCSGEKFGTIFYELQGGGGLPRSAFPITLNSVQFAVAGIEITGDILNGYQCMGNAAGGMVDVSLEVYAGAMVPTNITALPATGPWPGETTVFGPGNVAVERSRDMMPGQNRWDVRVNQIAMPNNGVLIASPNTYVRVVVTVPTGGSSASCTDLALGSPGAVPFRDNNGPVGSNRNFIYQTGILGSPSQWTWNEAIVDPITGGMGINGDWLIRLEVTPDAQNPMPDAGIPLDMGAPPADMGEQQDAGIVDTIADMGAAPPPPDMGSADAGPTGPPMITAISPDTGKSDAATMITVTGSGFVSGLSLKIGAITAGNVEVPGGSTVRALVPQGIAAGTYDVVVENPDGQAAILPDGFTVEGDGPGLPKESGCICARGASAPGVWWLLIGLLFFRRRR